MSEPRRTGAAAGHPLRTRARARALAIGLGLALAAPAVLGQPRVLAQRSQTLCQWPQSTPDGGAQTVLLDNAAAWQRHVVAGSGAPALARAPRWANEQVLLHVMPEQPTMGVRVSATRVQAGPVLVLQVTRPGPDQMAPTALSRPCVWVVVARSTRTPWKVRVQDSTAGAALTRVAERLDR